MIVLDASVLANLVGDDGPDGEQARRRVLVEPYVAIPDLADVESVAVFRRRWLRGDISARRFRHAIDDLRALPVTRFPSGPLLGRAYELRANATAYDACYVGLAEALGATLLTADARLAAAPGVVCDVEVLSG